MLLLLIIFDKFALAVQDIESGMHWVGIGNEHKNYSGSTPLNQHQEHVMTLILHFWKICPGVSYDLPI